MAFATWFSSFSMRSNVARYATDVTPWRPDVEKFATRALTRVAVGATLLSMTKQRLMCLQIRSRLALQDKTQKELGEALGLSRASLSARINGHRDFSFSELEAVADFLGVAMADLFVFERGEVPAE